MSTTGPISPRLVTRTSTSPAGGARSSERAADPRPTPLAKLPADGLDAGRDRLRDLMTRSNDVGPELTRPLTDTRQVVNQDTLLFNVDVAGSLKTMNKLAKMAASDQVGSAGLLRDEVVKMDASGEYAKFLEGLSPEDKVANAPLLQLMEVYRTTGKTVRELADSQHSFLVDKAQAESKTVGAYINDLIKTTGYGGKTSDWDTLSPAEQKAWNDRFEKAKDAVYAEAQKDPNVWKIVDVCDKKLGHSFLEFNPKKCDELSAFAYTSGDSMLHAGKPFVEAVEEFGPEVVMANVVHEIGGHENYGSNCTGASVMGKVFDEVMDPAEKQKALEGGNSWYSTYGYPETEAFAESYEQMCVTRRNPTDYPYGVDQDGVEVGNGREPDVRKMLTRIREFFAPEVAKGIVAGLSLRVECDDFLSDKVKALYRAEVEKVFG